MVPCTLTDLIVPETCILTNAGIMQERENILRKGRVPEEDGNRTECNEVGEGIPGPSSMDIDQSTYRHISITSVTAMMIR